MSLEDTLANMSLYDAKKYFRKAQNVMYNYTDMEGKVREATNNEPWGASSTLMEQIAQGTYNLLERQEILGMVFRRFTEKSGSEWRQIYKALQLLDYLIRHGSERFIDDVRSSIRLIELLESFHYIDSEGRDQGINVRNRAQEITSLLQDDSRIRSERKKARDTTKKYKGVAGGVITGGTGSMDTSMNTSAGFNKSHGNGISVSADFDHHSDDEGTGYNKSSSYSQEQFSFGGTNENPILQEEQDEEEEEDDDDEFSEFQSATPITTTNKPTVSLLDFTNDIPSTSSHPTEVVIPAITTANETKKSDPFSSLFNTAKVEKPRQVPTETTKTTEKDDEDDDIFGEMTSAPTQPASTNEDLLDLI
ncbi:similar to Saccharomyces cerevisiae YJR125C ENT3 Protein containing an N-terminal epsin-like domain involved in clathrin recruitment and traffic between the Golgi and endosomes [Maudiozyma saulgeensis]|uniref:Similar to Saccharomyces cerevisiae YJR125C ENT3 Protein containing an N-terminal epsin-like domain involved in clathrin recruitment and traffic between the Golgi and endosomes n=1 Tax=Maudiozyma saulgeensis TaxID=1789683 RepID=A0A1X7RAR6_9SACH|nr:similar to Saccharomyces cerevisiae YJR125C ENT3 Protein containing an N-terminal epsin-like domain involved in clathrin recruitment and traffic between the Golgi and endosomes [Kazachstania saulgeensis]